MAWVKLDENYQFDPKVLAAGALAELLYVRSLAWAKRMWKDEGRIDARYLGPLTMGMPGKPTAHVQALIDTELWSVVDGGWQITAWAKRNVTAEHIEKVRNERRIAGAKGNANRLANSAANDRAEVEVEAASEVEPEAAAAAELAPPPACLPPAAAAALDLFVDHRMSTETDVHSPRPYASSIRRDELEQQGPVLIALAVEGKTAREIVESVWGLTPTQIARIPRRKQ